MKVKTWHLFLVIILLFGCSFYIVNLKFDKFYRVNGINNDNRVLIEKYLDEEEQTYLIDNQIPISSFIEYIKKDNFHLQHYQYYNYLKTHSHYKKTKDILDIGNSLATRLNYLFNDKAFLQAKRLIDSSLEMAFLSEENFSFEYIELYARMQTLYDPNDFSYVEDTQLYIDKLNALGIVGKENIQKTFEMMTQAYSKDSLKTLLAKELKPNTKIVFNPYELSTVVDETHYIGEYEPKNLLLIQDVPRLRYSMYLQSDAYYALTKMYRDLSQKYNGFLLTEAYVGSQSLEENQIGFDEKQLGLTIKVTQSQIAYADFKDTELSKWLEEHAHEYGFVLRYPPEKASITSHKYDAHTYRYVGKSLAQSLYSSHLTLEEYQAKNR